MKSILEDLYGYRTYEYYEELIKLSRVTGCETEREIEHMKQNRASYSPEAYDKAMKKLVAAFEEANECWEWAEINKNCKSFMDGEYLKDGHSDGPDSGAKKAEENQKDNENLEDEEEDKDQEQDLDLLKGWAY
jgi:hypothetical protein